MSAAQTQLETDLCRLFGIRYPIVQTGMGYVSDANLTAATSAAGGLGILAGATLTVPELNAAIATIKTKTDAPFGVNLRADHPSAKQMTEIVIANQVKVASFALAPKPDLIARLKDAGVLVIPSIG